ncbi:HNH endonuclease signature motif containing protein [Haematomicrobium sanguinis]|uniref:HNH endonuclease signature motif containing protein n=1 Tax=Haematomicrobium sanguinis TaxID=479106 RepID=UPI00047AFCAB|nr:HNH endonuclease signature motif containing protein [Haematomicrobium sanguinis]
MNFPLADQDLERRILALESLVADVEKALDTFDQKVSSEEPIDINGSALTEKRATVILKQWNTLRKRFDSAQHVGTSALLSIFVEEYAARELNNLASLDSSSSCAREPEEFADVDSTNCEPAFVCPVNPLDELKSKAQGAHANFKGLPAEFVRDPVLARAFSTATYTLSTELACLLECTELRAHQLMHQSVLLLASPQLEKVHRQGLMSWGNAQELLDQSEDLPQERLQIFGSELAEYLSPSTGTRPTRSRAHVRRKAQHVREELHAEPLEVRRARRVERRNVYVTADQDGMATITAHLPAESAHAIMNTLNDVARSLHREQPRAPGLPGTPNPGSAGPVRRSMAQIRADVFVDMVLNPTTLLSQPGRVVHDRIDSALPQPWIKARVTVLDNELTGDHTSRFVGGVPGSDVTSDVLREDAGFSDSTAAQELPVPTGLQPKIFVTVSAETLAGLNDDHALLHDYGPIPAETARQIAAQAPSLYRMLVDPISGVVLDLERKSYRLDRQTRDYLHLHSHTCQFPGCSRSARNTDIDHIQDWNDGGTSAPDNLQLLCRKHHNMKTHYGWTCTKNSDNTLTWRSPLGNEYFTEHAGQRLDRASSIEATSEPSPSADSLDQDEQLWQEFREALRDTINAESPRPGRGSSTANSVSHAVFAKLREANRVRSGV